MTTAITSNHTPTMINVTCEAYDKELVPQIADLEALIQSASAWDTTTINDMLRQDIYRCWAVIGNRDKEDIHIIAYCIWSNVFEVVEILRIGTHPNHQRQGLAYGLIKALQKYASRTDLTQPIEKILLEVRENNTPAIQLYTKMGFVEIDRRRNYYKISHNNAKVKDNSQEGIKSTYTTCDALIMQYTVNL